MAFSLKQGLLAGIAAGIMVFLISCEGQGPVLESIPLSKLSFEQIEREMIEGGLTSNQLEVYSKTVKGKKVQWSGQFKRLDGDLAYVAMQGTFPNVEFQLSLEAAKDLQPDLMLTFTGLVESVSLAHTSPPMPKAYVVLKYVRLSEEGSSSRKRAADER